MHSCPAMYKTSTLTPFSVCAQSKLLNEVCPDLPTEAQLHGHLYPLSVNVSTLSRTVSTSYLLDPTPLGLLPSTVGGEEGASGLRVGL